MGRQVEAGGPAHMGRVHADTQAPLHQSGLWRRLPCHTHLLPTGSKPGLGTRHVRLPDSPLKASLILARKWEKAEARVEEEAGGGDTDPGCLFRPGDDCV